MEDIEKVIKGLTQCTSFGEIGLIEEECNDCSYCERNKTGICWAQMNRDALELLKEQNEYIKHLEEMNEKYGYINIVRCKDCKFYEHCEIHDLMLNHENGFCADGVYKENIHG